MNSLLLAATLVLVCVRISPAEVTANQRLQMGRSNGVSQSAAKELTSVVCKEIRRKEIQPLLCLEGVTISFQGAVSAPTATEAIVVGYVEATERPTSFFVRKRQDGWHVIDAAPQTNLEYCVAFPGVDGRSSLACQNNLFWAQRETRQELVQVEALDSKWVLTGFFPSDIVLGDPGGHWDDNAPGPRYSIESDLTRSGDTLDLSIRLVWQVGAFPKGGIPETHDGCTLQMPICGHREWSVAYEFADGRFVPEPSAERSFTELRSLIQRLKVQKLDAEGRPLAKS